MSDAAIFHDAMLHSLCVAMNQSAVPGQYLCAAVEPAQAAVALLPTHVPVSKIGQ